MKIRTPLLSALLLAGFGVASAQPGQQQSGADRDDQRGVQQGQQSRQQGQRNQDTQQTQRQGAQQQGQRSQDRDRDQQIAAAGRSQSDKFVTAMEQNHIRTDELERSDLVDAQGEDIGNIAGVLIDGQSGEVTGLLVNVGGLAGVGARTVALAWDAVEITPDRDAGAVGERYEVRTQLSMQELEDAPEFDDERDQVAIAD